MTVTPKRQASSALGRSAAKLALKSSPKRHLKLKVTFSLILAAYGLYGQATVQAQVQSVPAAPTPTQLPQGANVAAGQVDINQSGNVMNIDQSTQKAIINWQEFNVGADAKVNFNQPGADSATLNRVLSQNPSQIFGQIVAPGQVILINPNGAYFAPSASVDVGGLIATTHELADKDFLDGNYEFKRNGATGAIINDGELKAKLDGYIALMAPEVRNQGVIVAERGTVALASGEHIQLDFGTGNKLQGITVTEQDLDAQIENKHAIIAEGGLVILSARATAELRASVIKNSGQIVAGASANTVTEKGGRIILEGNTIEVTEGSELIATGPKGGGEILIGGDWQGGRNAERRVFDNPDAIHEATAVTVDANTRIDASATDNGDGGTVVVWSDVSNPESVTIVQGEILARGGENGGDGGQIETSGARLIANGVRGSAAAPMGLAGEWLFDPYDIFIVDAGSDSNGSFTSGDWTADGDDSTILNTSIQDLLNDGTSVTISTAGAGTQDGNITVNASIIATTGNANLSFVADGSFSGNADITTRGDVHIKANISITLAIGKSIKSGGADVVLWANATNQTSGAHNNQIDLLGNNTIITDGGSIVLAGGLDTNNDGVPDGYAYRDDQAAGGVRFGGSGTVMLDSSSSGGGGGGGNIIVRGQGQFAGVDAAQFVEMNAGTGTLYIEGVSDQASTDAVKGVGVYFRGGATLTSANTTNDAVVLIGDATDSQSTFAEGIRLKSSGTVEITATGTGGGVSLTSRAGPSSRDTFWLEDPMYMLANGGDIKLTTRGGQSGARLTVFGTTLTLGSTDASRTKYDVTSSTSDILVDVGDGGYMWQTSRTPHGMHVDTSGTLEFRHSNYVFDTDWVSFGGQTLSGLTVGDASGNSGDVYFGNAFTVNGPIAAYGHNIFVNQNLTTTAQASDGSVTLDASGNIQLASQRSITTNANTGLIAMSGVNVSLAGPVTANDSDVLLQATGAVTQSAAITANKLGLAGSGTFSLTNPNNVVSTLAGGTSSVGLGSVQYVNAQALAIATVDSFSGVVPGTLSGLTTSGEISVATVDGNLTVSNAISTGSSSANALVLNAGQQQAAGIAAGGDIVLGASSALSVGTGGRILLYTGSLSGSSGVVDVVVSGSGRFRYNADESTDFSAASWQDIDEAGAYAIYRQQPSVQLVSSTMVYGELSPTITYATNAGPINGDTAQIELSSPTYSPAGYLNAGSYTITDTGLASLGYALTLDSNQLTVAKAALTITAAPEKKFVDQPDPSFSSVFYDGFVTGEDASVFTQVGSVTRTTSGEAARLYEDALTADGWVAANYTISYEPGDFTILAADVLLIRVQDLDLTYGDTIDSSSWLSFLTAQYLEDDNGNQLVVDLTVTYDSNNGHYVIDDGADDLITFGLTAQGQTSSGAGRTKVGSYALDFVNLQDTNNNFNDARVLGSLVVTPKILTDLGLSVTKMYDGNTSLSGATITSDLAAAGVLTNDSVSLDVTGSFAGPNVGSVKAVTFNSLLLSGADAVNYALSADTFSGNVGVITPRPVSVTGTKVYDGTTNFAGSNLIAQGINGETLTISGVGTLVSKNVQTSQPLAGVAGLSLGDGTGLATNYVLQADHTAVDVTPLAVTLSAAGISKVYDGSTLYALDASNSADATAIALLSAPLVGDDEVASAQMVFDTKDVSRASDGTVLADKRVLLSQVTINDGNDGKNYRVRFVEADNGRIDPAALTVTAVDDAKFVLQPDPVFSSVFYTGFVAGEDASVFTKTGSITRTKPGEQAQTYTQALLPSGWEANNYTISYVAGDFVIVPADQLLVRAADLQATYGEVAANGLALGALDVKLITAQYVQNGDVLDLVVAYDSSAGEYVINDGAQNTITFNFRPVTPPPASSAGFAQVGGYRLQFDGLNVTNSNFKQAVMVGALTVMPKVVNDAYTLEPYTKPFDGNTSLAGFEVDATAVLRGDVFLADDVQLLSDGRYDTPTVGTDKMVTVSFALTGSDANNYRLATPVFTGAVGTITSIDPKPPKPPQPPVLNITDGLAGTSLQQVVEHFRKEQELAGALEFDVQAARQSSVLTQSLVSDPIAGWPCLIVDDRNQLHAQQTKLTNAQRIWFDEHGCEFLDQAIDANR